jgi:hypothetical protein
MQQRRKKMKTQDLSQKGLYVGTGAGLILFALVGLLPGSLIGGAIGLQISAFIFGSPVQAALLPRIIIALSMVVGILGAAFVFVVGTSVLGWAAGLVVDTIRGRVVEHETEAAKTH